MRKAVVVSTARTGIGKAFRGTLNMTKSPTMAGYVLFQAVERAGSIRERSRIVSWVRCSRREPAE